MTKARTLANFISDGSTLADGAISVSEVSGAAPLASPSFTGNVGIGVTPATFYGRALHVHDTGTAGANIRLTDSNSGTTGNDGMDILQINNTSYIINREAGGMNFYTGGQLRYTIQGDGTHVFNENGLDTDFRVESDSNTHALFVDAGNGRVGLNNGAPSATLHVNPAGADIYASGLFTTTNAASYSYMDFQNTGTSGTTWQIGVGGNGTVSPYQNSLYFYNTVVGGFFRAQTTEVAFNEGSVDMDFRVESNSNTHMLFVDAGNDRVSIANSGYTSTSDLNLTGRGLSLKNDLNGNSDNWSVIQNDGASSTANLKFGTGNGNVEFTHGAGLITNPNLDGYASVFNETSKDCDFRVESNSNSHMLFVNAGDEYVSVNTDGSVGFGGKFNVNGNKGTGSGIPSQQLTVADSTAMRAGGGGAIQFNGVYDTSNNITAAGSIEAYKRNATSGNYGFGLQFKSRTHGGTNVERLYMDEANTAFNDVGANVDFRIESDAYSTMFQVDAGNNWVSIGQAVPATGFDGDLIVMGSSASTTTSPVRINRSTDGYLIRFMESNNTEGYISVSGSTVSYNGFAGRHESSGIPTTTARGTVVSTIDELDEYLSGPKQGQDRADHAKVEVSNTVGDPCVYGVVDDFTDDGSVNVVSVGIAPVRVTGSCAKGDLLESNGDGTAKVQSDDIIRSKTIGKVTIGNSDAGVKLVPCVMYCG